MNLVKDFEEPTSVALTNAFLNNCINVIKAKKVANEVITTLVILFTLKLLNVS